MCFFGLIKAFNFNSVWSKVILIQAGMPPAINNIILADHFGLDKKLIANLVTETTALALVTIPILTYFAEIL